MSISLRELFDIVAAGEDLAAEDAAFLCQRLDPFLWRKALEAAGPRSEKSEDALTPSSPATSFSEGGR